MLAHLTTEVPLKKGDFQPIMETKSKNNILLRFYFLLLSYSLWMCTWLRLSIHHPRRNDTADSALMKYTRQAIDRCRETARRRVLYLWYVPHLPKKCCITSEIFFSFNQSFIPIDRYRKT
jgi:hypothetical protein